MRWHRAQELKRKLAAILIADVKGYSRLMGEGEEWTVRTLDTFKGVMKNIIPQHRGRVVDSTGDNLLAEFASVVDAVQAAVEIQQVLRAKNSLLPENRRMEFRIGINRGDVIEEGERIFGDGVNIAARLEGLAAYASPATPSSRSRTSCRCTTITWASTRIRLGIQVSIRDLEGKGQYAIGARPRSGISKSKIEICHPRNSRIDHCPSQGTPHGSHCRCRDSSNASSAVD
jgi:hypothetical protein